jgi:DNA-binding response OmpR family regulator
MDKKIGKSAKVMIVDDHKDITDTLKTIVEKIGCQTEVAYNGMELLQKVEKFNPDILLLDVMMPGYTTKTILTKLKEKNLGKIKIILVTVVRFEEQEIKSLMSEFNIVDYITKPFTINDLIERIKKQV